MAYKKQIMLFSACCLSVALSGCYTVLSDPFAVQTLHEQAEKDSEYERRAERDESDRADDFYRYPGVPGSYGAYGTGYPLRGGYSGYGGYGGYPTPYGGYSSYGYYGYGPYSYGYDPYYTDSRGYYVPPGYELVSTRDLDDLRSSLAEVDSGSSASVDPAIAREQERKREEVWTQRVAPQIRRPDPTPRSTTSIATPSAPAPSPQPSAVRAAAPASKTTSSKESATPTKRRR